MFELDLDSCVLDSVFFPHQAARFSQRGFGIFVRPKHKMAAHGGHFRCDCPYVGRERSNSFIFPRSSVCERFSGAAAFLQKNVDALGHQFP